MADISPDVGTWSSTPGSNQPTGATTIGTGLDDNLRATQAGVKAALEPLSSVAGTNTITATCTGLTAYYTGERHFFTPANTNTGATTINITGIGAKSIFSNGAACVGGEIVANVPVDISYDGTQFNIVGQNRILAGEPSKALHAVPLRDLAGYISGLIHANNAGDATNDIDIAVGVAVDTTKAVMLRLASALTKRLDASWVTGTNQGGLSSSLTIGNNDYYVHLIRVAGVDDVGFDTSATAANLIADHSATHYRPIAWIKRVGATIVAFHAYELEGGGLEMKWDAPTQDIGVGNALTTSRRTDAVKVPLNFSTIALMRISLFDASSNYTVGICCPDETDAAPDTGNPPGSTMRQQLVTEFYSFEMAVRTSSSGLIAARATLATVDTYRAYTLGFRWNRR